MTNNCQPQANHGDEFGDDDEAVRHFPAHPVVLVASSAANTFVWLTVVVVVFNVWSLLTVQVGADQDMFRLYITCVLGLFVWTQTQIFSALATYLDVQREEAELNQSSEEKRLIDADLLVG